MKINYLRIEVVLIILIFLLGIGVRFLRLGVAPLSDFEAASALQSLQVSRGEKGLIGPAPGYVLLTGGSFYLFEDSNTWARLWPALAGSLLVLLPFTLRSIIGRRVALIIALGLALDPGLVFMSRLAGGLMFSLGFGLFALGCLLARRPLLAGIFGGLALLGGPSFIPGALVLILTYVFGKMLFHLKVVEYTTVSGLSDDSQNTVRDGLLAGGGAILIAGTLFFLFPGGLGALATGLPDYLNGWLNSSGIPLTRLIAALVVYQPLALTFGLIAAIRGWRERNSILQWLSLWAFIALLVVLAYPSRQVGDVAWVLVPLWGLAGFEIANYLSLSHQERIPALGQAALILILLALAWLNLAGVSQSGTDIQALRLRWTVIAGTLALGIVTTFLVALGWSPAVAKKGLAWGLVIGMGMYFLANTWGISQVRPNGEQDLWAPGPVGGQVDLLIRTLGDLSEGQTGFRDALDVAVVTQSPSVQWALRGLENVKFYTDTSSGILPSIIIDTEEHPEPSTAAAYRGQDFAWWIYPAWQGAIPLDWPRWLVFRQAPQQKVHVILWARSDLFPGGTIAPGGEVIPGDEEFIPGEAPLN